MATIYRALELLLVLSFCWNTAFSQEEISGSSEMVNYYRAGEAALLDHQYKKAIRWFEKALDLNPDLVAAHRGIGLCYQELGDYSKAAEHYQAVIDRKPFFSRILYFQLAEAYYKTGNHQKALEYFGQFRNFQYGPPGFFGHNETKEKDIELEFQKKVEANIRACQISLDSAKFLNIVDIINLGPAINTKADEYFPCLTNDQQTLFYTHRKNPAADENLFYSTALQKGWKNGTPVSVRFNTPQHEGMSTLVRDGRRMYFTACNQEGVLGPCDIREAAVDGTDVSLVGDLKGLVNSERWESQAAISCDGSTLFFASNRQDGFGGTDIWYSKRMANGAWSEPINLGPKINTELDEEAPYITNDGKTLYFSSTGHPGMGDQDIFMSWMDDNSTWSVPINLGPPVNTPYREFGFFLSADGKTGYFASNRPGGFGGIDIYQFELSEQLFSEPVTFVEGFVRDSLLDTPVATTLNIFGREILSTGEDGRFFLCVPADSVLHIKVDQNRYFPYRRSFPIPLWDNRAFYTIEILLDPLRDLAIKAPQPVDPVAVRKPKSPKDYTHTVFFDFDSHEITPDQFGNLDEFLKSLKGKEITRVEIIGFADDIGADVYNLRLSEERAKKIALFMLENGIVVDQIYMEGKGEIKDGQPKELNRKVEVKIYTLE